MLNLCYRILHRLPKVWVSGVTHSDFSEVDKLGSDYNGLGTELLELLFKKELLKPDNYIVVPSARGKLC